MDNTNFPALAMSESRREWLLNTLKSQCYQIESFANEVRAIQKVQDTGTIPVCPYEDSIIGRMEESNDRLERQCIRLEEVIKHLSENIGNQNEACESKEAYLQKCTVNTGMY